VACWKVEERQICWPRSDTTETSEMLWSSNPSANKIV